MTLLLTRSDHLNIQINKLTDELGKTANIKSSTTKNRVHGALTSIIHVLKQIDRIPDNGLALFSGTIESENNKEKKIMINLPLLNLFPVRSTIYRCDKIFHTESFRIQQSEPYGFLIIDGNGALFGILSGQIKQTITSIRANLPKKHSKGGQSAQRFGRIRMGARVLYMKKIAELATKSFIDSNNLPNIRGLILAGSSIFKSEFEKSSFLDPRLQGLIQGIFDIEYGGNMGFNQAIQMAEHLLSDIPIMEERKAVNELFDMIALNHDLYSIGLQDTMTAHSMNALKKILIWSDTTVTIENQGILEWAYENRNDMQIILISDKTSEGMQFIHGFGGIAGILRFPVNFIELETHEPNDATIVVDSLNDFDETDFM